MKKIAFYSKNLEIGGMEKALVNLLNLLANEYEIYLFLEEKKGILLNQLDNKVIVKEYKLFSFKNVLIRKILNFTKRCFFYIKYHNKFYFSCSYATYSVICSKLALISSKNNSLYIHSNYAEVYKNNSNFLFKFFSSINIQRFKKIFFVSVESKNELLKYFPNLENNVTVINNVINGDQILNLAKEECNIFNNERNNLLYVGRLDKSSKNFELLLSTFKKIIDKNHDFYLTILGSGKDKEYVNDLIKKYNVIDNIKIVSSDINPYKYMANADAIILTSYYEGFPVIYLESLILNKIVFTTIDVSDGFIDTRKYFYKLTNDSLKNSLLINDNINKKINYNFNYNNYNEYMINKFIKEMEN